MRATALRWAAVCLLGIAGALDWGGGAQGAASEPALEIRWAGGNRSYTRTELLQRSDLTRITISHDPAYDGKAMSYQAVPLHALWKDVPLPGDALLQVRCLDGFSGPIARGRALNASPRGAIAYVAVEPADAPWPKNAKGISPGPFYLVWKDPEKSAIQREEWPFQLVAFSSKGSLAESYPAILPDPEAGASVRRGLEVFVRDCFACHTLNRQGDSKLGPDLNVPMSVTEYWKIEALRAQVRNPQGVRYWPQGKMPAFPKSQLSDEDLSRLVEYLRHMATRKVE